jgi:hypothetical protein
VVKEGLDKECQYWHRLLPALMTAYQMTEKHNEAKLVFQEMMSRQSSREKALELSRQ